MEWQKPLVTSYNEEDLIKELQIKAYSGTNDHGGDHDHHDHDHHHHRRWW